MSVPSDYNKFLVILYKIEKKASRFRSVIGATYAAIYDELELIIHFFPLYSIHFHDQSIINKFKTMDMRAFVSAFHCG